MKSSRLISGIKQQYEKLKKSKNLFKSEHAEQEQ